MRVFVLGAGASVHAGYPLAAEMGNRLAGWIRGLPVDHPHNEYLDQIVDTYGTLDNFESILADLMTCDRGSKAATLGVARPYVLAGLEEAIREHFDVIRAAPRPLYDCLARILLPGDTVVTFNYDLGIDRALQEARIWDVRTGYGFVVEQSSQPSPVELLKLHGSTNWRALLFGGMTGCFAVHGNSLGRRPVLFFRPDLEYLGYPDFADSQCARLDTAATLPAMILPALPKVFHFATTFGEEWKDFWDSLWDRAARAISEADELVIIGYSLPVVDERARALLLDTNNKTVRLTVSCANATANIEKEFYDHGFSNIESGTATFESFLSRETGRDRTGDHADTRTPVH